MSCNLMHSKQATQSEPCNVIQQDVFHKLATTVFYGIQNVPAPKLIT